MKGVAMTVLLSILLTLGLLGLAIPMGIILHAIGAR